jgi:3-hydroxybutyryl-CoA dehydrogenase
VRLDDIETIGVIGAGDLGRRLATDFLSAGYRVLIFNRTPESSRASAHAIRTALAERAVLGALTSEAAAAAAGRLVASLDVVQAGGNAEFVVEAVAEDLDLKREMFRRIEEVGDADVIIASSSCGIAAEALAARLDRPERFLVTRYDPRDVSVTAVSIHSPATTDPAVVATTRGLLRRIRAQPRD